MNRDPFLFATIFSATDNTNVHGWMNTPHSLIEPTFQTMSRRDKIRQHANQTISFNPLGVGHTFRYITWNYMSTKKALFQGLQCLVKVQKHFFVLYFFYFQRFAVIQ